MPSFDSDKIERALLKKMKADRKDTGDWYYTISDEEGNVLGSTTLSKGAKDDLSRSRVSDMSRQLHFDNTNQFSNFIKCEISREEALVIIKRNYIARLSRKRR